MTALYDCSGRNLQLATMLMECHGVGRQSQERM